MSWVLTGVAAGGASLLVPMAARELRKIRGSVVNATATVLSLRQFGSVSASGPQRMVCRIRLRIDSVGAEPYETTVWQNIAPWDLGSMTAGSTVAVQISEASPKRVRIAG